MLWARDSKCIGLRQEQQDTGRDSGRRKDGGWEQVSKETVMKAEQCVFPSEGRGMPAAQGPDNHVDYLCRVQQKTERTRSAGWPRRRRKVGRGACCEDQVHRVCRQTDWSGRGKRRGFGSLEEEATDGVHGCAGDLKSCWDGEGFGKPGTMP